MSVLLLASDAARLLGVTPATVRMMARRGELRTAATTQTGTRLFAQSEVERLAKRRAEERARHGA